MAKHRIALLAAQTSVYQELQVLLGSGFEVVSLSENATDLASRSDVSLFIVANTRDDPSIASAIVRRLRSGFSGVPVFVVAWVSSEQHVVAALREGVTDYFSPRVDLTQVAEAVRTILKTPLELRIKPDVCWPCEGERPIIGESLPMRTVRSWLMRVGQRDCNALVLGETGTGKDLIAEAIHANGPRRNKPFISLNCAAIPETLLESELFGYERGAFTGASSTTCGKIQQAHGGTIFFDEIGDMSPSAQAKMLRVIETRHIQRLGGKSAIPVNVRIIAATNQDLPRLVSEQRFRKDLYFRLCVAKIELPPLRERREDIPTLLDYYVRMFNRQTGASVDGFTPEALDFLVRYNWPGNVRELKNSVEAVFVDPPFPRIDLCHLCMAETGLPKPGWYGGERDQLLDALEATRWNKSRAAEQLRWSRMKIYRKMTQYKIANRERPDAPAIDLLENRSWQAHPHHE